MVNHPNRRRTKTAAANVPSHDHEHDYSALLEGVTTSFSTVIRDHAALFQTDADGLMVLFLDGLPSERQTHTCHACAHFMRLYGGVVAITEAGEIIPAMWNPDAVPEFYRPAFQALHNHVKRARVVSRFLTKQTTWGMPLTGKWSHIAVTPPASLVYRERLLTAGQAMAANKENFRTIAAALTEFTALMLDEALRLLTADSLARSEKFIGPVKWLRALHDRPKGRRGENVLWRAVATAPEGYCHPKASMIAPLLEDIVAGLPFAEIKARFDAKMHPLLYQRPQAAPTAGNIKAAEEMVAKLGIERSLERRFARLDEVQKLWTPQIVQEEAQGGGVFGHLKPKNTDAIQPVDLPPVTMTWEKFTRTVLPTAERMECYAPAHGNFVALLTAEHADAPPILKWDREEERNPVSWYVYNGGSPASQWGLLNGWINVTAIVPAPPTWGMKPMPFLGEGITFVLYGAVDSRDAGNALFPECLKDDLHGIRATIEAYSRDAKIGGRPEASACGYAISKGKADCRLRVLANKAWIGYNIDRWD